MLKERNVRRRKFYLFVVYLNILLATLLLRRQFFFIYSIYTSIYYRHGMGDYLHYISTYYRHRYCKDDKHPQIHVDKIFLAKLLLPYRNVIYSCELHVPCLATLLNYYDKSFDKNCKFSVTNHIPVAITITIHSRPQSHFHTVTR
jgi:hypothetical protein